MRVQMTDDGEPHYTSECELCQLAQNNHSATPERGSDRQTFRVHFYLQQIVLNGSATLKLEDRNLAKA